MAIPTKHHQSFPLKCRLSHSFEFDAVFEQTEGRLSSNSLLLLAKQNHLGFNRLGMIISKKSIPKSVQRTQVKRRIRETFRKTLSEPMLGWDIVVMTRPKITSQPDLTAYLRDSFTTLAKTLR